MRTIELVNLRTTSRGHGAARLPPPPPPPLSPLPSPLPMLCIEPCLRSTSLTRFEARASRCIATGRPAASSLSMRTPATPPARQRPPQRAQSHTSAAPMGCIRAYATLANATGCCRSAKSAGSSPRASRGWHAGQGMRLPQSGATQRAQPQRNNFRSCSSACRRRVPMTLSEPR